MTERLFDKDAYIIEFDAMVTEVCEYKGRKAVVLDRTCFFPEEGGQSPDTGDLNGLNVTDVQIKDDIIYHFVDGELSAGDKVRGKIDWDHRFRNMQCHSAEHCFSGLVHSKFGADNVGFHLSDNTATMDYNRFLTDEELKLLEAEVNRIIINDRSITASYPDAEELSNLDYRSKKELSGAIRIVRVDGVDICACCAPHVRSTGEIGFFKIIDHEKYKGGIRIYYLAGFRAIADYESRLSELREISKTLSVKTHCEAEGVKELKAENEKLRFELTEAKTRLIEYKIKASFTEGSDWLLYIGEVSETDCIDMAARFARKLTDSFAVFMGDETSGYRFVIESAGSDANRTSANMREKFSAKCGGKDGSVRGSLDLTENRLRAEFGTRLQAFGENNE